MGKISMVEHAATTVTKDVGARAVIRGIRAGRWRAPVEIIRANFSDALAKSGDRKTAKRAVEPHKKKLPGVLWSGRFSRRKNEALIEHSGLLCIDLDGLGDQVDCIWAKLTTSPHLWAMFRSPTGDGIKAIFRVAAAAQKHRRSFDALQTYVEEITGVRIDESGKDEARLCFVSYDPTLLLNASAPEFPLPPPDSNAVPEKEIAVTTAQLELRRTIVVDLLGAIRWRTDAHGFCQCPGKHLHETSNGERDCEVHLDDVPTVHCFHNHCKGIIGGVNHELRSQIAKAERRVARQSITPAPDLSIWGDPKPLPADLPAVPPFKFGCLPNTLRPWIEDIADRMQCPPDFPAVGATVALGAVIGRKIGIRPKRYDDWLVIANLWGFVIGRPGLLKTPALEEALRPLRRLIAEALEKYQAEMQGYKADAMLCSQQTKLVERAIKKCLQAGNEEEARAEAEALAEWEKKQPILRRYEVNDSTVAKLGELLAQNPNGLLLHRDELVGFLRALDKEGYEEARAFFLEAWNGTGIFTFDRIGRGTVRVESNTISLIGAIQPDLLSGYVREAVRGGAGADGLLQRIQLGVWPDVSREWRNVDCWPSKGAKDKAFDVFKYLDHLTAEAVGADGSSGIPFLRFASDAQEAFDFWRADLEKKLRSDTEHPAFEAHLAKYRKLVPALALLIHLANRDTGPVSLAALEKSLLWATYLEAHARRIYSAVLRPDIAAARELAKHLQRGDLSERFTLRETYRKGWTGLSAKEDAEAATEILCDMDWIRAIPEMNRTAGRPPSVTFEINPKIRQASLSEPTEPPKCNSGSFVSRTGEQIKIPHSLGAKSSKSIELVEEFA